MNFKKINWLDELANHGVDDLKDNLTSYHVDDFCSYEKKFNA